MGTRWTPLHVENVKLDELAITGYGERAFALGALRVPEGYGKDRAIRPGFRWGPIREGPREAPEQATRP